MQRLSWPPVVLTIVLVVALAARAGAQERLDVDRARELFAEGVAMIEAERWAEAAERFRRVLRVRSTAQVKFNLALALHGMGELAQAASILREITGRSGAPRELRDEARELLASIEPRIGRLTIRIAGDEDRASISIDGDEVGLDRIGYPIAVDPGTHRVALRRGGEELSSREVHVPEGESREVTLSVDARARAGTLPEPQLDETMRLPEEQTRARQTANGEIVEQWWFWAAIGAIAAVLVTVVVAVAVSP